MTHSIDLILTLAGGLCTALIFGLISQRLKMSPIVGYLVAGIVVGPYLPGPIVVNLDVASQFAEVGVILLMFGVGLHFQVKDLLAVRKIALPGALAQIIGTTVVGMFIAHMYGQSWAAGAVYGMSISVASTVMLMRVLEDNKNVHTPTGHIAIGWLIVEDLFTILAIVMLPVFFSHTGAGAFWHVLGTTTVKLVLLVIFVLVAGQKIIPKLLSSISRTGSKDLFTLAVLAIALGIAVVSAKFFGASMALGAFLAGMVVGQSDFSARAASEALPMKDAFAVLFFVSVGMLLDPHALISSWQLMLITLAIILIVKPVIAIVVVLVLRRPLRTAISVGVALAQIGEFSFILASLAIALKILPPETYSAIIAAAIISLTLNPLLYKSIDPLMKWMAKHGIGSIKPDENDGILNLVCEKDKMIIVGYGPIGKAIAEIILDKGINVVVIDLNMDTVKKIKSNEIEGLSAVNGDASQREILLHAGIECARTILISSHTAPAEEIIEVARSINPSIQIVVNTTYNNDVSKLKKLGADLVFSGENAIAQSLSKYMFREFHSMNTDD